MLDNITKASEEAWKTPKRISRLMELAQGRSLPKLAQTPHKVVAVWGRSKLLEFKPEGSSESQSPIVMIPSIINRWYVLDLRPGQSYVEYLVEKGHTVYVLDWGTPAPQDGFMTLEDHVVRYVGAAVRRACQLSGKAQVHLMGYCVGGTFAILYAALRPERVASLIPLTAPVNFHDEGLLSCWASSGQLDVARLAEVMGSLPPEFLQSSFSMLAPVAMMQKNQTLMEKMWDDSFVDRFLTLETWLNDNVSFPGATYAEYIHSLYEGNKLVQGTMTIGDELVDLKKIACPVLTVTASADHIVPPASATVLNTMISSKDQHVMEMKGGHIGITVGRAAKDGLWKATDEWLKARPCPNLM